MTYRQITEGERYQIAALKGQGLNKSKIAQALGRHRSTIGRELQRNLNNRGWYTPTKAQKKSNGRRKRSRRNQQFTPQDFWTVDALLIKQFSPEQVSGYLQKEGALRISHETIYRHVWSDKAEGGSLYKHLRCAQKRRRKRYNSYDSRGRVSGKRHISERPAAAENRTHIGHWEIDTVMGKGDTHCIVTVVDRRSGYLLIGKLPARTTALTNECVIGLIEQHPGKFKTITSDNGTEFHGYRGIEAATNVPFYFATPHHSWERGSNENTNGLIRQYLRKGRSMAGLTQERCNEIADKLNTRPRKRHGYRTPEERFYGK
jgi:IS30 family transposase